MPEAPAAAPFSSSSDAALAPLDVETAPEPSVSFRPLDTFARRHLGSGPEEVAAMLDLVGYESLEALVDAAVPPGIRMERALDLPEALSESEALAALRRIAGKNQVFRSYIGQGYHGTITPPVIQRNILENPGWYTAYTPYQAEIAQGRLEALLNFQTMVCDITGLAVANASLLDEATAAAEAMAMCFGLRGTPGRPGQTEDNGRRNRFFVSSGCHPQTLGVVRTRAEALGIEIVVGDHEATTVDGRFFGVLLQYPATNGRVFDLADFIVEAHAAGALAVVAADPLALCLLKPPGEFGADVAVGSTQRFGVPMGFGGPHAAYFATKDEFKRNLPGRLVGVSRDAHGKPAYRLSLQTREQHIRRDKATSNICTAQVLLAVMASMYAVYHGPDGLRAIAERVHGLAGALATGLRRLGFEIGPEVFFDTLTVKVGTGTAAAIHRVAEKKGINLRRVDEATVGITLDEAVTQADLGDLLTVFSGSSSDYHPNTLADGGDLGPFERESAFLTHPVFNRFHTETEMLRYLRRLESRDLSLTTSMIPLGSCTMKLNATAEMFPVTWSEFGALHPFAPAEQAAGYRELAESLERWLAEITGFHAVSLQPNAGSQGEYAGLLAVHRFHQSRGEGHRNICLIPTSAHGTNPASAVMAGYKVVAVKCDREGNIDVADLRAQADKHRDALAALMVTYPSTHGVFESTIREICTVIHERGGQVYMDGANLNAQVGLCRPGDFGADVCHLNLHKTFCIPHGGGGPGVGPIGVAEHLAPFLPGDPRGENLKSEISNLKSFSHAVSAAPLGSASILVISWLYIAMMGPDGLTTATTLAILNANYIAKQLEPHFPVLYRGNDGLVAHECILDLRGSEKSADVKVEDIAKRLMDYGYHAPTVSWPVAGTMMVEPTESESKAELDRFCDAMIAIHTEIKAIENGESDRADNPLKHAPHTAQAVTADDWPHKYGRALAAYPAAWLREHKFWPAVGRIDNVYGDRNLICSCPPVEDFIE